ncbi:RNA-binding S4 domain-containing protein [Mycoplasmopsis bovirhinis]|uniref:S4-like RNA-binding protein n=1 Tax=Mycoplasmopsis bovirhinis TaxID=29553 RepID=A0A449AEQ6_9BACT|nr:RNA-binding S4 domain-containing protein [Mycoplasmopsis bovirhinis]VEU63446.1 s4-like RNA-binding protein [Mycoplasmopsis bovirhinis]
MKLQIDKEFIKIGQLLKYAKLIETGGQARFYINENDVLLNGEKVVTKNTKARTGDIIWINNEIVIEID